MALIPDEAIDRMTELSAGAWRLYCFLARCRNQKTGRCFPSAQTSAEAVGAHLKHISRLRRELVRAGWARFKGNEATLLIGFTGNKNATAVVVDIELTPAGNNIVTETPEAEQKCYQAEQKCYQEVTILLPTYKEEPAKEPANRTSKEIPVAVAPGGGLSKDECYALFVELRSSIGEYEAPYQNQTADFVHLAKLLKNCERTNWTLTREKFAQAATHYFATPQKVHTLADLATRFSEFYKSAFDKFGKPVAKGNGPDSPMAALTPNARKTVAALESWLKRPEKREGT